MKSNTKTISTELFTEETEENNKKKALEIFKGLFLMKKFI